MNSKEGNWLTPQRNAFIGIDILRFFQFFSGFRSSLHRTRIQIVGQEENARINWLQFGAIFRSVVRLASVENRFTHSGSGNLSVEFYNFPADEFAWCALQFHLIQLDKS